MSLSLRKLPFHLPRAPVFRGQASRNTHRPGLCPESECREQTLELSCSGPYPQPAPPARHQHVTQQLEGTEGKSPGDEPSSEHGLLGMEPTGKPPVAHAAHIGQLWGHGRDKERRKPVKNGTFPLVGRLCAQPHKRGRCPCSVRARTFPRSDLLRTGSHACGPVSPDLRAELCKRTGGGGHCRDARSGSPAVLTPAHQHNVSG